MPPRRSQRKNGLFDGMSPDMQDAIQKILGDDVSRGGTSGGSVDDIVRRLTSADPADLDKLLSAMDVMDKPEPNLDNFDFSKVSVKKNSFWVMQLNPDGFCTPDGQRVETFASGCKPLFSLYIYDERSTFRVVDQASEPGMPPSAFLLKALKRAIASPLPPFKQSLPSLLIIALKLSPHIDALRPFLNSLPAPFKWRLETPEEAAEVAEGIYEKNKQGVTSGIRSAESEKALGNQAIARKDRTDAIKHYTEAIESLYSARVQNPTEEERKQVDKLFSVCYANRAAAWLMEGQGQDPNKALKDAEDAANFDEHYAKAYYRQAKSYHLLSDKTAALSILYKALQRPALVSEKGLNDFLIEVHGGFPDTEDGLRKFCIEVFRSPNSVRGLKEFEARANAQVQRVFGPDASIDSI